MSQRDIRKYKGTKIFKYHDPFDLETIKEKLTELGSLLRIEPDRDVKGEKKELTSAVIVSDIVDGKILFGNIIWEKQEFDKQYDDHWISSNPLDFLILAEPSVLIIHGSKTLMDKVVEGLERAIHYNNDPKEPKKSNLGDNSDPYFTPYGIDSGDFNKFVVKKIVKAMENFHQRNYLYDPHFQQLSDNIDVRGGECFWRRDGVSAFEDERFCYLFELCTFWTPELKISSCGGIASITPDPIITKINSDFSFTFSKTIPKEQLDIFWNSLVLPILLENNYEQERIECVQNAKDYEGKLKTF